MKKGTKRIGVFFFMIFSNLFLYTQKVFADDLIDSDKPARLSDSRDIFVNVMIAIWALAIPYFIYNVIYIGAQWMLSQGDQGKLTQVKQRGGKIFFSVFLVFGGYLIVRLLIILLDINHPAHCFNSPFGEVPMFEFFFARVCE